MYDPIERGHAVADFMARDWFKEAIEQVKTDINDEWKSGSTVEARETAFSKHRGLEALLNQFQSYVDGGITAQSQADRAARRRKEI